MGCAERVVFALGALGEARQAAALAERADAVAPPGQDLVRIGLVADVPDQAVARRVEHIVQGDRELDDAEPAPRWPPVTETALIVSARSSSATCRSLPSGSLRRSCGVRIVSRRGVDADKGALAGARSFDVNS